MMEISNGFHRPEPNFTAYVRLPRRAGALLAMATKGSVTANPAKQGVAVSRIKEQGMMDFMNDFYTDKEEQ